MSIRIIPKDHHLTSTSRPEEADLEFFVYQDEGHSLLGPNPSIHVALETSTPIFHEAGAFFAEENEDSLFVTSNQVLDDSGHGSTILIHRLFRSRRNPETWNLEFVPSGDVVMANGGIASPSKDSILFCAQGSKEQAGGLALMGRHAPFETRPILRTFHGRWFNSVNDVVYAPDGAIWFTDPIYGFEQGFRNQPELPCQVYRYDPKSGDVRPVADGLQRPKGLCFSPDGATMYITDTDYIHGNGSLDSHRVSHIYAFSVKVFNGAPFLTDKRLFAMADSGAPDGIKCDTRGNVFSGCGDGVCAWNPTGQVILKIKVQGGVANFCLGRPGEVLMFNETRFVVAKISDEVQAPY